MSKIIKNSAIYSILNLLQKGINFILIPVLTAYLTTFDFGVVAVVTVINSFLNVFYLLALNGSLNRFYYEYKEDVEKIKILFGTVVTFVFFFSALLSLILAFGHQFFLDPFLKNVEFYPYMLLGMISIFLNPIFTIYQDSLMARQEASRFGKNSFLFFLTNVLLLLLSVTVLNLGAVGVLGSLAITNFIFFIYTISRFGKEITLGIDMQILKQSLKYSLPLVPHSIAGVTTTVIDKLIINGFLSTSLVGIYHLGNTFGGIIFIISSSVNKAFVPWFNEQAKKNEFKEIPSKALMLILCYCLIALGLSLFGKEIIKLVTPTDYHQSWVVIPFISFAFVLHGVYYFFSVPLFYDITGKGNRILPILTIFAALINVGLNLLLIPKYGILGAAVATLIAKIVLVITLSFVYKSFLDVGYSNVKMIVIPLIFFSISLISFLNIPDSNELVIKIVVFIFLIIITGYILRKQAIEFYKLIK